jgi:hypothetical protein
MAEEATAGRPCLLGRPPTRLQDALLRWNRLAALLALVAPAASADK